MSKKLVSKISGLYYSSDFTADTQRPEISDTILRLIPNEKSISGKTDLSLIEETHLSAKIIRGSVTTDISSETLTLTGWFKPGIFPTTLINGSISVHISEQGKLRLIHYDNYDPRTIITAAHLHSVGTWIYLTIQRSPEKLSLFQNGILQGFTTDPPEISITGIGGVQTFLDDIIVVPNILWTKSFIPPEVYL